MLAEFDGFVCFLSEVEEFDHEIPEILLGIQLESELSFTSCVLLVRVVENSLQVVKDVFNSLVWGGCVRLHTRTDVSKSLSLSATLHVCQN